MKTIPSGLYIVMHSDLILTASRKQFPLKQNLIPVSKTTAITGVLTNPAIHCTHVVRISLHAAA